jgi:hypothetical protein
MHILIVGWGVAAGYVDVKTKYGTFNNIKHEKLIFVVNSIFCENLAIN